MRISFALVLLLAVATASAVVLKPAATVEGPVVRLSDVALLTQAEGDAAGVVLASAPSIGLERKLSDSYVASELKRAGFGDLTVSGSQAVSVGRATRVVSGRELAAAAADAVIAGMPWDPSRVAVDLSSMPADVTVPSGELTLTGRVSDGSRFAGAETVLVALSVDGEEFKTVAVPLCVRVKEPVLVASRYVSRRSRLSSEDFIVEERDISGLRGEPASASSGVAGLMAKGVIKPGEVLLRQDVVLAPVVERGDVVAVLFDTPALKVSAIVEVRESGGPGELVLVRNPLSKKEFYAQVVDSRTLCVPLGGGQ